MVLCRVVSRLLRQAERAKDFGVVWEALTILEGRLDAVQTAAISHRAISPGHLSDDLVVLQHHLEHPIAWKSTSSVGLSSNSPIQLTATSGFPALLRTLKTSPGGVSKSSKRSKAAKAGSNRNVSVSGSASKLPSQARSLPQAPTTSAAVGGGSPVGQQVRSSLSGRVANTTANPGVSPAITHTVESSASGETAEAPKFQFSGSEEERKGSAVVRVMAVMVLGYIGLNIYPLMGDSLATHAVALTRSKDPFLQRSGASRVAMIATNDKRRRKIVELGGVASLAKLARNEAVDDVTLDHVLDALVKVCEGRDGIVALQETDLGPSLRRIIERRSVAESSNAAVLLERSSDEISKDG